MVATAQGAELSAPQAYAHLLLQLHDLIDHGGADDSEEAEAIYATMDAVWHRLTNDEQERLRGLAADLNVLATGGPEPVPMSQDEVAQFGIEAKSAYLAGNWDKLLALLRRPHAGMVPHAVKGLQGRSWEQLGFPEVALGFMTEAERSDPEQAVSILPLLQEMGRLDDAVILANRVIENPRSSPGALYLASDALFALALRSPHSEAKLLLERVVAVLRRALRDERALPPTQREFLRLEVAITVKLGVSLEQLEQLTAAIQAYSDALSRFPDDAILLALRGGARLRAGQEVAFDDFSRAAGADVPSVMPYYFLAHRALNASDYHACWKLSLKGLERAVPPKVKAQLYEMLAIAQAALGQPMGWVRYNFDNAEMFDPGSEEVHRLREAVEQWRTPFGGRARPREILTGMKVIPREEWEPGAVVPRETFLRRRQRKELEALVAPA
jgi:tetratricopeptide (TPR) repeat protein